MSTQLVNHNPAAAWMPASMRLPPAWGEQRRWFAVFTRSHHEKRVAQYYTEREIEHLLPICRELRQWSHYRKVAVDLPLFPNYIFVHISRWERTAAMKVPGALSLVGQNRIPVALPDAEIESLREGLKQRNAAPHPYLVAGDRVRITKGALAGKEGIVVRNKNSCRVVLTLALIMRSFAVGSRRRGCGTGRLIFPPKLTYSAFSQVLLGGSSPLLA